jgi:pimeloyl-ACP methyl ester carboxylesterase
MLRAFVGGSGTPTVVFEAGLGCHSSYWGDLPGRVAATTSVVTYDRAGLGQSDGRADRPTPAAFVADLAAVLERGGGDPPYILVGHSFGGFLIRSFAARYPALVGALLFVDSATENEMEGLSERVKQRDRSASVALKVNHFFARIGIGRLWFVRNQSRRAFPKFSRTVVDSIATEVASPRHWQTNLAELEAYPAVAADARGSRDHRVFKRVPLSVVTAVGYPDRHLAAFEMARDQFREFHLRRQREALVSLSPAARHLVAEQSGHLVQHDDPDLLVAEIDALVNQLRGSGDRDPPGAQAGSSGCLS